MKTKTEQLEICRTCNNNCCECEDSDWLKKIQGNLFHVHNLFLPADTASYFGKAPCQTCGDELAGDRYKICGKNNKTGAIEEFIVCIDCYGYLFT